MKILSRTVHFDLLSCYENVLSFLRYRCQFLSLYFCGFQFQLFEFSFILLIDCILCFSSTVFYATFRLPFMLLFGFFLCYFSTVLCATSPLSFDCVLLLHATFRLFSMPLFDFFMQLFDCLLCYFLTVIFDCLLRYFSTVFYATFPLSFMLLFNCLRCFFLLSFIGSCLASLREAIAFTKCNLTFHQNVFG